MTRRAPTKDPLQRALFEPGELAAPGERALPGTAEPLLLLPAAVPAPGQVRTAETAPSIAQAPKAAPIASPREASPASSAAPRDPSRTASLESESKGTESKDTESKDSESKDSESVDGKSIGRESMAGPSRGSEPRGSAAFDDASLDGLLAPAVFQHPQAEREIELGGHRVGYALRRSRRRSIGFVVSADGLGVNAPKWVGVREIEAALREKSTWILRKLVEQRDRVRRLSEAKVEWRDGTSIPFLGETVIVVLDPRAGAAPGGALLNTDADSLPGVAKLTLHVGLPHSARPEQIRDIVQSWLQRQARRIFEERCALFTARLGVRMTRLALSSAQTRWGSASASGAIRLNWRLVHFAMPTIDYVVAHELAHLREMNHGARFWEVVRSVVPDYEQVRQTLRSDSLPAFE